MKREPRLESKHESDIIRALESLEGVIKVKPLNPKEREEILKVETQEENKIAWGMCKSFNEGVREALNREFTIAIIVDSSKFKYPYHPHMEIRHKDRIVGEQVNGERAAELRKQRTNIFLWDTFVIYFDRMPRGPAVREEMRLYYLARPFEILKDSSEIRDCVLGVPSMDGDAKVKELLSAETGRPEIGTCLVGCNLSKAQ